MFKVTAGRVSSRRGHSHRNGACKVYVTLGVDISPRSLYRREGLEGLHYKISDIGYPIFTPEVRTAQGSEWESKRTHDM